MEAITIRLEAITTRNKKLQKCRRRPAFLDSEGRRKKERKKGGVVELGVADAI